MVPETTAGKYRWQCVVLISRHSPLSIVPPEFLLFLGRPGARQPACPAGSRPGQQRKQADAASGVTATSVRPWTFTHGRQAWNRKLRAALLRRNTHQPEKSADCSLAFRPESVESKSRNVTSTNSERARENDFRYKFKIHPLIKNSKNN